MQLKFLERSTAQPNNDECVKARDDNLCEAVNYITKSFLLIDNIALAPHSNYHHGIKLRISFKIGSRAE